MRFDVHGLELDDEAAREAANMIYVLFSGDTTVDDIDGVAPVLNEEEDDLVRRLEENADIVAAAFREAGHQYKKVVDADGPGGPTREDVATLYELADDIEDRAADGDVREVEA